MLFASHPRRHRLPPPIARSQSVAPARANGARCRSQSVEHSRAQYSRAWLLHRIGWRAMADDSTSLLITRRAQVRDV